jgi:hypothetical protein
VPAIKNKDSKEVLKLEPSGAPIDSVKLLNSSSYVLTGCRQTGSLNVWSSKLGLNLAGGLNFRHHAYKSIGKDSEAQIFDQKLITVYDKNGVKILIPKQLVSTWIS